MIYLHAVLAHFPIALLVVALIFEIATSLFRRSQLKSAIPLLLLIAIVAAVGSIATGHELRAKALQLGISSTTLFLHQALGYVVLGLTVLLLALRMATKEHISKKSLQLYLLTLLAAAVVGIVAGYLGNTLVYDQGAGVKADLLKTRTVIDRNK